MKVYEEFCFERFKPHTGEEEAYKKILDAGKGEEFTALLESMYPDGISRVKLSEMLVFFPDRIYERLGMKEIFEEEDDGYSFEEREDERDDV